MAYNKVILRKKDQTEVVLLDLTDATDVLATNLAKDEKAYNKRGVLVAGAYELPSGNLNIVENGQQDVSNYAEVTVNVQPSLQDKTITPSEESQIINADTDYYGLNSVTVEPIPADYLIPTGTLEITANGDQDVTTVKEVTVKVQPKLQDTSVTPTKEVQEISAEDNYYGLGTVTVKAIPDEYIIPNLENRQVTPTTDTQTILPGNGFDALREVVIDPIPNTFMKIPTEEFTIEDNGSYDTVDYAKVHVKVQPVLQSKDVVPTTVEQTIIADEPNDGLSSVTVKAIQIEEKTANVNGDVTPSTGKYLSKVSVNVQPALQTKTVTPTKETINVTKDDNYYGLNKVTVNPIPADYIVPTGTTSITTNGTHNITSYAAATVNVQPALQTKTVTPTKSSQNITKDEGYYGLSSVTVNPIPGDYIIPKLDTRQVTPSTITQTVTPGDGFDALSSVTVNPIPNTFMAVPTADLSITTNGTHNVLNYSSATVNVQPALQSKEITPSTSEQTITADAGNYGLSSVKVKAIQTEEKTITVNNSSIVPTSGKYLSKVTASLPMQTKTATPTKASQSITPDSTYQGLSSVTVNPIPDSYIIPTGSTTITTNGTVNVTSYASAVVNVQPELQSKEATPSTTEQTVTADTGKYGLSSVKIKAIQTEEKTATTNNSSITPTSGKYLSKVTVSLPMQAKTVTPTTTAQTITPDTSYQGLSSVSIGAIPSNYIIPTGTKTITTNGTYDITANASAVVNVQPSLQEKTVTANGTVTPDNGYYGLSKVTVNTPEFKIAYGTTAPTDTSKLWVKRDKPNTVEIITTPVKGSTKLTYATAIIPQELTNAETVQIGTKIYLFGGISSRGYNTSIRVLDTATNKFTTLTINGLTNSLHKLGATAVGTKVYLFGGQGGNPGDHIYVFDTSTNSFSTLSTTIPSPSIRNVTAAAVGTKIYLFGGGFAQGRLSTIYVFDTTNNSLTALSTTLPAASDYITAAVVDTKIYLFGGDTSNGPSTSIQIFDTATNTLTKSSTVLPTGASNMGCAVINKKIYLFGGASSVNGTTTPLSTINVFNT